MKKAERNEEKIFFSSIVSINVKREAREREGGGIPSRSLDEVIVSRPTIFLSQPLPLQTSRSAGSTLYPPLPPFLSSSLQPSIRHFSSFFRSLSFSPSLLDSSSRRRCTSLFTSSAPLPASLRAPVLKFILPPRGIRHDYRRSSVVKPGRPCTTTLRRFTLRHGGRVLYTHSPCGCTQLGS